MRLFWMGLILMFAATLSLPAPLLAQQDPAAPNPSRSSALGSGSEAREETPVVEKAPSESKTYVTTPEEESHHAEMGPTVKTIEVRFAGPKTTNESVIRANVRTKEGQPFTQTQSDEDVRQLYATGLFSNVRIYTEPEGDGVKVIVLVQGKSKIKEILFTGNEDIGEGKLRKQVKSKAGDTLSERQIAEDANAILELYEKAGFQKVKVNFEVTPDELTGRSVVKFIINEGKKVKIAGIQFEGNKNLEEDDLRKAMETKKYNWLLSWITKKGYLREDVLNDDKQRIIDFYRSKGYIDADVKDVKMEYPEPDEMIITVFVYEGQQYKVGDVNFVGNKLFDSGALHGKLKMASGQTFTPGGLQDDVKAIRDYYGSRGYIDTRVDPVRTPNVNTGRMDLTYHINEGELVYLNKIEIQNNIKTKDKVVRRELLVQPGDVYDTVKVDASKKRLENLGYFSRVTTSAEATDVPNRRNLIVNVDEQRTGEISFGVGFSSVDSLLGFVEVSQGNFDITKPPLFTGGGQKFRAKAQYGLKRQDYIVSFTEPWFLDEQLAVGGDAFYNEASFLSSKYDEKRYGADVRVSRGLDDFTYVDATYKFEQIDIFNLASDASPVIQQEQGTRSKSSVVLGITRDERDSVFLPSKGYRANAFVEVAGGPLMGQTEIYKIGISAQKYFTMPWLEKHILQFNLGATTVDKYGDARRVPIFDRLFLGGPGSIRGFDYRDISPKDNTGEPIGGRTSAFLQMEYSIPLIERVRFAVFNDVGMVSPNAWSFRSGENWLFDGAGVGLRLNLPIGPINLDFGVPVITNKQNDSSGKFHFNAGYQF